MLPQPIRRRMSLLAICFAAVAMSCRDMPFDSRPDPFPDQAKIGTLLGCRVDVRTNATMCERLGPDGRPIEGAELEIIPDAQWMVETMPGAYTPADSTYRLNLRVMNSTGEVMGTPDGSTVSGIKVFLPVRPMGYHGRVHGDTLNDPYGILMLPLSSINQSVHARNHDGVQSFTKPNQPYWNYPEKVDPWAVSGWREWQFTLHPDVSYFYFSVGIFAAVPGEVQVPEGHYSGYFITEDSLNVLFSHPNIVVDDPRMSGRWPRSIVQIIFHPAATRDERQSAIDAVGGRLIGVLGAVLYQVVLDEDGTTAPLWRAVDRLKGLPQVSRAGPDHFTMGMISNYRLPESGLQWQLSRDSADGANWAAEAISAPWAWGCEIGNTATQVAIIDYSGPHSEVVSSIMHRPIVKSHDIPGIMWAGTVSSVVPAGSNPGQGAVFAQAILQAFSERPQVVNLSFGAGYWLPNSFGPPIPRTPSATQFDSAHASDAASMWSNMLLTYEDAHAVQPLYVVAAGNFATDAYLSGLPQLRSNKFLGDRVVVVAASTNSLSGTQRDLWTNPTHALERGSNHGELVEIAAPGGGVHVHIGTAVEPHSGTSLAAPHVAAVAGLLKSFDPRLTADSLKILLLQGAVAGARTSGGYPHLDAFEALKAAARRPTAPLCDNRIWVQSGTVFAQRDTLSSVGDALFSMVDLYRQPDGINVLHGGKKIFPYTSPRSSRLGWEWRVNGGVSSWEQVPFEDRPGQTSGSFYSRENVFMGHGARSHDGDTAIIAFMDSDGPITGRQVTITPTLWDVATWAPLDTFSPLITEHTYTESGLCSATFVAVVDSTVNSLLEHGTAEDIEKYFSWRQSLDNQPCTHAGPLGNSKDVLRDVAYSPRGNEGFVFVHTTLSTTALESTVPCELSRWISLNHSVSYQAMCRTFIRTTSPAGTRIFRLNFATLQTIEMPWRSEVEHLGYPLIRENGREMTVQFTNSRLVRRFGWSGRQQTAANITSTRTCRTQYRSVQTGAVHLAPVNCWFDNGDGGFSPDRRR
jgi:hypothetical protein